MSVAGAKPLDVVVMIASAGLTSALTFVYIILTGRALGPAAYSDFAAALSIIFFGNVVMTPLAAATARRVASRAEHYAHEVLHLRARVLRPTATVAAIVAIGGMAGSPFIAQHLHFLSPLPIVWAFAALFLIAMICVDRGVMHGLLRMKVHNRSTVLESATRLAIALLLYHFFAPSSGNAILAFTLALVVAELDLMFALRTSTPAAPARAAAEQGMNPLYASLIVLMISLAVFQNVDMIAVKEGVVAAEAGIYGAAAALTRSIAAVFVPFFLLSGPVLTRKHLSGESVFLSTLRLTGGFVAISAAALAVFLIWPKELISLVYGPEFVGEDNVLGSLATISVITLAGVLLAQALITLHRFRFAIAYAVFAGMEIALLIPFHASVGQILKVVWICQSLAFAVVIVLFMHAWKSETRATLNRR